MKEFIKKLPLLRPLIILIKRKYSLWHFPSSEEYWEKRYISGGNSGPGSYNKLAEFKAKIVNDFVKENNISTVMEGLSSP